MENNLDKILDSNFEYISKISEEEMSYKRSLEKWSKKEILGHLIDSAINNLQRFTEIQFEEKTYKIRGYKQNELVIANDYQNSKTKELLNFWLSINKRISAIMKNQNDKTLSFKIETIDNTIVDLKYLMKDYIKHLEHHLQQIKS